MGVSRRQLGLLLCLAVCLAGQRCGSTSQMGGSSGDTCNDTCSLAWLAGPTWGEGGVGDPLMDDDVPLL